MEITATNAAAEASAAKVVNPNSILGQDDFLKLLCSQLTFQDPLNPMSNEQFAAQMAQFSSLEQMSEMNETMQVMQNNMQFAYTCQAASQAAALIGKNVSGMDADTGLMINGVVESITVENDLAYLNVNSGRIAVNDLLRVNS
ncbi:MAG: flagellar hook capping protein [Candidatus Omnitrophota bacterium]|nr:MAG: flagellar hook capping protein [Candidatus Omnitrophota bacterium]